MARRIALVALCLLGTLTAARAQAPCRVYKTFNGAVSNTGTLVDTINVPDAFSVGSIRVSHLALGHPAPASLALALMHRTANATELSSSPLRALAEGPAGTYAPDAAMNAAARGQWVLRVTDPQPGAETRLISLASWTLVLCPSAAPVVANDGPAPPVVRAAGWEEHSKNLLDLLIPGAKGARPDPDTIFGVIATTRDATKRVVVGSIIDAFDFAVKAADLYKDFVSKKLSDATNLVNVGSTIVADTVTKAADGRFKLHHMSLRELLANLKALVSSDVEGNVDAAITLASELQDATGEVADDLKATTSLLHKLVVAKLTGAAKVATTVEGVAKAHVDRLLASKVDAVNGVLDKIIGHLEGVQDSKWTPPLVDVGLKVNIVALEALSRALDRMVAIIEAAPLPTEVAEEKKDFVASVLKKTRVAELLKGDDDGEAAWKLGSKLWAPLRAKAEHAKELVAAAALHLHDKAEGVKHDIEDKAGKVLDHIDAKKDEIVDHIGTKKDDIKHDVADHVDGKKHD